jgi:hypothetical protein
VGLSRQTASQVDRTQAMLAAVHARIATDHDIPDWYADTFSDLLRFSTARLAISAEPVDHAMLQAMAARTTSDRVVIHVIWSLLGGRSARIATLAWLWFRLKPYGLLALIRTAIARRFEQSKLASARIK